MTYPKVKIIADSINSLGKRITTYELEYWRSLHAELLTHKMLSRNSSSSRAIPVSATVKQVLENPAMPSYWGKNQAGMQAKEELTGKELEFAKDEWRLASKSAADFSRALSDNSVHKQIANRVTEPFQWMKVVVTATEWNNCWYLRDHPDAQPEIQVLFHEMKHQYDLEENVNFLKPGEWHLPYIHTRFDCIDGQTIIYLDSDGNKLTEEQALRVSASCCAQASYRKLDASQEKADDIFKRLVDSKPVHASPLEHAALCIDITKMNAFDPRTWQEGLTHVDRSGKLWSGNLQGWIQHRQLIQGNYLEG